MSTESDWGIFPSSIDDQPAWVFADLKFNPAAASDLKSLTHVRFAVASTDEDGLPTPEATAAMHAVEDAVVAVLEPLGAVHVGSVTCAGTRSMYFYSKNDRGLADALRVVAAQFPASPPSAMTRPDPKHEVFTSLLTPNIWQEQFVKNTRVSSALQQHGDNNELPRSITHFAYFSTAEGKSSFAEIVKDQGFTIVDEAEHAAPDTRSPFPWAIKFEREDVIDVLELTNLTAELMDAAMASQGEYDGWETHIVK